MKLSDFDYALPEDQIALRPVKPRSAARLLVARGAEGEEDRCVDELPTILAPGDLLVFNDTKVIAARLHGIRRRTTTEGAGARVEATLIERVDGDQWIALAKPGRKLAIGDVIHFSDFLSATIIDRHGVETTLLFSLTGSALDSAISAIGVPPLPPYIASKRAIDDADNDDYQTIFASKPGAVAAPTASLHFDDSLIAALELAGVDSVTVTLHIGGGTFLPVATDDISQHQMHSERGALTKDAAEKIKRTKGLGNRVIPVGTTALRLLETAARDGEISSWSGATDLFIKPGYRFAVADGLMTNFHLPRSTLLILVAAMMGRERILRLYAHAVRQKYRFYSYGDACLLLPKG
jgi:S-adenosylmethionine:tRNA ribosyltransferase-isomerase